MVADLPTVLLWALKEIRKILQDRQVTGGYKRVTGGYNPAGYVSQPVLAEVEAQYGWRMTNRMEGSSRVARQMDECNVGKGSGF